MTVVEVQLDEQATKVFRGHDIEDALKKLRRSPTALRAFSKLGMKWSKTLFWPVVKPQWLQKDHAVPKKHTDAISDVIPFLSQTEGTVDAQLDFNLQSRREFLLELTGNYEAITTQFSLEKMIQSPEKAKNLLRTAFTYILAYNLRVEQLSVQLSSQPKGAHLTISADVPRKLRKTDRP